MFEKFIVIEARIKLQKYEIYNNYYILTCYQETIQRPDKN